MKANFLGMAAALALVSCCAVETAQASPIDVSYSVSGSPGEWLLDFTVTNNLDQFGGPGQLIYLFAVALPSTDISMSPPNWTYAENVGYGGPVYNNAWCINACGNVDLTLAIHTGQTLTGFQAVDTALIEPTSLLWTADSASITPGNHPGAPYTGPDCVPATCNYSNPSLIGSASLAAVPTPIAGAGLPGMITVLGIMGLLGWRRRRRARA
jgi:hypothetical protein